MRKQWVRGCAITVLTLASAGLWGCKETLFGAGVLYIHNGGEEPMDVVVDGRTSDNQKLRGGQGLLLHPAVAGHYVIKAGDKTVELDLPQDGFAIVNPDGKGCFARADVSKLYKRANEPVIAKEVYSGKPLYEIREEITIFPGEDLPATKPASDYALFRVAAVPCDITKDMNEVGQFIRKLH